MSSVIKIAEELGLNASTVSRALNNRYGVSEKTRRRVMSRINELTATGEMKRANSGRPLKCRVFGVVVPDCAGAGACCAMAAVHTDRPINNGSVRLVISDSFFGDVASRPRRAGRRLVGSSMEAAPMKWLRERGE